MLVNTLIFIAVYIVCLTIVSLALKLMEESGRGIGDETLVFFVLAVAPMTIAVFVAVTAVVGVWRVYDKAINNFVYPPFKVLFMKITNFLK